MQLLLPSGRFELLLILRRHPPFRPFRMRQTGSTSQLRRHLRLGRRLRVIGRKPSYPSGKPFAGMVCLAVAAKANTPNICATIQRPISMCWRRRIGTFLRKAVDRPGRATGLHRPDLDGSRFYHKRNFALNTFSVNSKTAANQSDGAAGDGAAMVVHNPNCLAGVSRQNLAGRSPPPCRASESDPAPIRSASWCHAERPP